MEKIKKVSMKEFFGRSFKNDKEFLDWIDSLFPEFKTKNENDDKR